MKIFFLLISITCVMTASAAMEIVQIGGGNKIDNSQGQIEDNVIWLNHILRKTGNNVRNYYASGKRGEKDVALFVETYDSKEIMSIARVFSDPEAERILYRHNRVGDLSGGMYKEEITESLERILTDLPENKQFLLIYNGHGGSDDEDVRNNYIKLWGEGELNVSEVDRLFDSAPDSTTIRYVFPQCYSGGFYGLVHEEPHSDEFGSQLRCGFFAESPFDESEGCSLNTNRDEYRDYSTYFFAPLNGGTRNGEPLPFDPDLNADGVISFAESHLYAIKAGHSKDLSRSTSEIYLEEWMPWYLRWGVNSNYAQSRYWAVAEYVASREQLDLDDSSLRLRRREMNQHLAELNSRLEDCNTNAEIIAARLRKEVVESWPELLHPYTTGYLNVITNHSAEIAKYLESTEDYNKLVEVQESCSELNAEILSAEREMAQIEKILRYKRLAMIEFYFNRYASDEKQAQYNSLLQCENGTFFAVSDIRD